MEKLFSKCRWIRPIYGAVILVLGLVALIIAIVYKVEPRESTAQAIIIVFGIVSFVFGAASCASAFFKQKEECTLQLIIGAAAVGLGIALWTEYGFQASSYVLIYVLPIVLFVIGIALTGIVSYRLIKKDDPKKYIESGIIAIIFFIFGLIQVIMLGIGPEDEGSINFILDSDYFIISIILMIIGAFHGVKGFLVLKDKKPTDKAAE